MAFGANLLAQLFDKIEKQKAVSTSKTKASESSLPAYSPSTRYIRAATNLDEAAFKKDNRSTSQVFSHDI